MRRVAVTGMGIVSCIGNNTQEVLSNLREGKSGISKSEEHVNLGFRSQIYGKPDLDPEDYLDKKVRRFMGMGAAWNYISMQQAIEDSGLEENDVINEKTGIIMGSGGPSTKTLVESADITREKGPKRVGPFAVPKAMSSTNSATLATPFGIKGINYSISSACATSSHCIGNAYELIQFGKQDTMFAGGGEELNWALSVLFDAMGAMSSKYNDKPATSSRAYDKDRDGFVIAGGAGVLVLEEMEKAKARGAKIYAEITGYGAVRCMKMSMENIGCEIDYINPHATSTPIGDEKEVEAIRETFGSKIPNISATKSLTGHSLGAAGVQEAIYSILMMQNDFIAKSANIENIDPKFEDLPINKERIDNANIGCLLSNSFGFGGTNASLVFKNPNL